MSYESVILDEQNHGGLPVAYYALDEANGTAAVDLMTLARGTAFNGTYVASPTLNAQPGPLSGEAGGWPLFTAASSQYVNVGTMGTFGSGMATGYSIEAWFKTTSTAVITVFGHLATGNKMVVALRLNLTRAGANTANYITAQLWDNAATAKRLQGDCNVTFNDGLLHHVVATALGSSNTIVYYLDGAAQTTTYLLQETPATYGNFASNAFVGAFSNAGSPTQYWNGNLGRVALYPYVLAANRVTAHYLAGKNGTANLLRAA